MTEYNQVPNEPVQPPPEPVTPGPAAPEPPAPAPAPAKSGSLTTGITLIVVGGLLLAGMLLPGVHWWGMWPLIIVAVGLVQAITPGKHGWNVVRFFEGMVTVAWGLVFLAITVGLVGWSVFFTILALWPALLVSIGFSLLGKGLHSCWVEVIGSVVIILALAYAVTANITGTADVSWFGPAQGEVVDVSEPVGSVEKANLRLAGGAADVTVDSGDQLIEGEAQSPFGSPSFEVKRSGDSADVQVLLGGGSGSSVGWVGGPSASADVTLSDKVLWDLTVETGAAKIEADLSDLEVALLDLRLGASDVNATLGEAADSGEPSKVDVRSGVSAVSLRFPDDAEVRIESESGLTDHAMGSGFESQGGGVWETSGYAAAEAAGRPVWLVTIRSGVGSVDVKTY